MNRSIAYERQQWAAEVNEQNTPVDLELFRADTKELEKKFEFRFIPNQEFYNTRLGPMACLSSLVERVPVMKADEVFRTGKNHRRIGYELTMIQSADTPQVSYYFSETEAEQPAPSPIPYDSNARLEGSHTYYFDTAPVPLRDARQMRQFLNDFESF